MLPAITAFAINALALPPLSAQQIEVELLRHEIQPSQIELSDEAYVIPSHRWLVEDFLPYIEAYFEANGIRVIGEGLDCDNVAHHFRQQLALSNARGGRAGQGDIPCGVLKAEQRRAFGGVPGNGAAHSLILIRTDRGWHVIEPQTRVLLPLSLYPNLTYIHWALF